MAGFAALLAQAEENTLFEDVIDRVPYISTGLAVLVACIVLAIVLRILVKRGIRGYDTSLAQMLGGLVYIGLLAFGILLALWIVIPSVRFNTIFTSLGVTGLILGFALKDILENFVAGIIILWRRPFRAGDQVGSGEYEGHVEEINFRATVLRTFDGIRVYIPNSLVLTQPVQNFTSYEDRRSQVTFAIDQQAPIDRARAIILQELDALDSVLADPEPLVLFESVGDFANNLTVLFWIKPPTRMIDRTTRSEVTERLFTALQAGGIAFPYPMQVVDLVRSSELTASTTPPGQGPIRQRR